MRLCGVRSCLGERSGLCVLRFDLLGFSGVPCSFLSSLSAACRLRALEGLAGRVRTWRWEGEGISGLVGWRRWRRAWRYGGQYSVLGLNNPYNVINGIVSIFRDMQGRYCQEFSMAKLARSTNSGRSGNSIQPYAASRGQIFSRGGYEQDNWPKNVTLKTDRVRAYNSSIT